MQIFHMVFVLVYLSLVVDVSKVGGYSLDTLQTRHRRQTEGESCTLPRYPENGQWKLLNGEAKPGDKIPESSVVKFECSPGFKLSNKYPYLVCDDTWNSVEIPECEKLCPPLYPSTTFQLKCRDKRGKEIKCSEATDGTYVEYTCADSYETPFGYRKALLCTDGKWSQKPVCHPVCGKKIINDKRTLIVGTKPNNKFEYPWITTIYEKRNGSYEYICGGAILSLTVVLTAAHCVTNDYGDLLPKENYLVGAGKLYSKYQAPEDMRAQYLELSKIIAHEDYKGDSRRFLGDIAVLVVKGEFVLNEIVQPVCVNNLKSIYLHPGSIGEVSGWGRTEDEKTSQVLRTLKMPYKYEATCAAELPPHWADKFNIVDKICAGFFNKSISVCDGDSGNGLVFENPEDNRYYIHGIVSLGPLKEGQCDIQQNALYTKVAFYYEYIDRLLTTYAPAVKDCVLPVHPKNGKWTTNNQDLKPGDAVPSSTALKIECNVGFKLSSTSMNINCGSAHNMPTCQALCPKLSLPNGTTYACVNKAGQTIDCSEAVDGAKLWYDCPKRYKVPDGSSMNRTCVKGSWGRPEPECLRPIKICGKKITSGPTSGEKAEGLEFPWNINIYEKENTTKGEDYVFSCGGSLISSKVILTGATCVSNYRGNPYPKENYLIGAGKIYVKHNDSRDVHAQYSQLSHIILHDNFRGERRRYMADIAILVTQKPFTFNSFVQPVCFTDIDNIQLKNGDIGETLKYISNEEQEVIKIVYKDEEICKDELPQEIQDRFLFVDKACVGFESSSNLCQGDGGKGFFIKNPKDDRYYLHGIVSVSLTEDNICYNNILYTSVNYYYDFVDNILSKY